jgi:hypothetical protein
MRSPSQLNELELEEIGTTRSDRTESSGSTVETESVESVRSTNGNVSRDRRNNNNDYGDLNGQMANQPATSVSAIVLAQSGNGQQERDRVQAASELEALRQQVRVLVGALVVVIIGFSGGAIWLGHRFDLKPDDIFSRQTQTTLIEPQQSVGK